MFIVLLLGYLLLMFQLSFHHFFVNSFGRVEIWRKVLFEAIILRCFIGLLPNAHFTSQVYGPCLTVNNLIIRIIVNVLKGKSLVVIEAINCKFERVI